MLLKAQKAISSLFARKFNQVLFSSMEVPQNLRILQEKAYLASKLIQKITEVDLDQLHKKDQNPAMSDETRQKFIKQVKKQSLSQSLLSMIQTEKNQRQLSDTAVNEIRSFFTTGVKFDDGVFSQPGILSAQSALKDQSTRIYDPRFTFCPTYLISGRVFRMIQANSIRRPTIFQGSYGTSKSVSFMLYSMLSNIIAEYNFKTFGQDSKLKPYIKNVPKLIYFDYKKVNGFLSGPIKDNILSQCTSEIPLAKQIQLKLDAFYENSQKGLIKRIYNEKGIQLMFLVDQVDRFIAQFRNLPKENKKTNQTSDTQENDQANEEQLELLRIKKDSLTKTIQKIKQEVVGQTHFVSSRTLGYQQINQIQELIGSKEQNIEKVTFQYFDKIDRQLIIYELADCFLFLLQQKYGLNLGKPDLQANQKTQNKKIDNLKGRSSDEADYNDNWNNKQTNVTESQTDATEEETDFTEDQTDASEHETNATEEESDAIEDQADVAPRQKIQISKQKQKNIDLKENAFKKEKNAQIEESVFEQKIVMIRKRLRESLVKFLSIYPQKYFLTFSSMSRRFNELKSSYKQNLQQKINTNKITDFEQEIRQLLLDIVQLQKSETTQALLNKFNMPQKDDKSSSEELKIMAANLIYSTYANQGLNSKESIKRFLILSKYCKKHYQEPLNYFYGNYLFDKGKYQVCSQVTAQFYSQFIESYFSKNFSFLIQRKFIDTRDYRSLTHTAQFLRTNFLSMIRQNRINIMLKLDYCTNQLILRNIIATKTDVLPKSHQQRNSKIQQSFQQIPQYEIYRLDQKYSFASISLQTKKDDKSSNKQSKQQQKKKKENRTERVLVKRQFYDKFSFKQNIMQILQEQLAVLNQQTQTSQNPELTLLYVPINQFNNPKFPLSVKIKEKQQHYIMERKYDEKHNYIDCMLVTFNFAKPSYPAITFNAFGFIQQEQDVLNKITSFIQDFSSFSDLHEDHVFFKPKYRKIKVKTKINYFTLGLRSISWRKKFTQTLNQQFGNFFEFHSPGRGRRYYDSHLNVKTKEYVKTAQEQQNQKKKDQGNRSDKNKDNNNAKDQVNQTKNRRRKPCFLGKVGHIKIGEQLMAFETSSKKTSLESSVYKLWKKMESYY